MNTTTNTAIRNEFLLDPHVIYLNHGSFGATPRPVFDSYQRWQLELERQPTEFFGRRASQLLEQSRQVIADYLGTTSRNLAFVTNATAGMNVIINSLQLSPGDEVLSTNHEYGAVERTWRFHGQRQGYQYINQPITVPVTSGQAFVDELWQGVTPHTRVIFFSHITSPTGLIFPVQEVARRAREQGILTVIDGAHAPGQIDINLNALGVDFYTGNLHKWLCAPKGVGIVYARDEVMPMIEPLVVSWGYATEFPGPSRLVDYVEMQGTRDLSAFLASADAVEFQKRHDWQNVRCQCHDLLVETLQSIRQMTHLPPVSPFSFEWFSQMTTAPLPQHVVTADLHKRLYDEYRIEVPVLEWNGRKLMRLSIQAYNTAEQMGTLVEALHTLL